MRRLFEKLHEAFHRDAAPSYRVVNYVVWSLIVVSVVIFLVELVVGRSRVLWLERLDTVVLGLFVVELSLRVLTYWPPQLDLFTMTRWKRLMVHLLGRLRFCLRPITLIDFITVAALIPQLRGLRALRLLRLIRTWKFFHYSDPIANVMRAFQDNGLLYTFAFSLLGVATLLGGVSMFLVESGSNPNVNSVGDGMWWALVTLTTVGFGDISPVTPVGRVLGGVLMVSGLFTLALFAGIIGHTLLRAVLTIREEQFRMSNYVDHVVICGYGPRTEMLLDELQNEFNLGETDLVIFADGDRPADVPPDFVWISGDPTKESELDKARIAQARAVILVGSRSLPPQHADAVTILTTFTIRGHLLKVRDENPRVQPIYIVAEILDSENVEHALAAGANEVIETTRLGFSLLSHAVAVPGTAAIMGSVVSAGAHSLYLGSVPEDQTMPVTFPDLAQALQKSSGALVIGLRTPDGKDLLNPPASHQVSKEDRVIYLAESPVLKKEE